MSKTRSPHKVFNQPIQVTGKSRVDTWQKESSYQKRRRSPSPVRILHVFLKHVFNEIFYRLTDHFRFMVEVVSIIGMSLY
jgi:hypothetical protein